MSKCMNKQELVDTVMKDKNAPFESKRGAERAVNAVLNSITEGIKKDGSVQLIGFGTFNIKQRGPRKGRNPQTGEPIKIKASKSVGFRAGSALNDVAKKAKPKKAASTAKSSSK